MFTPKSMWLDSETKLKIWSQNRTKYTLYIYYHGSPSQSTTQYLETQWNHKIMLKIGTCIKTQIELPIIYNWTHNCCKQHSSLDFVLRCITVMTFTQINLTIPYLLTYEAEPFLGSCQLCSHSGTSQHFKEPKGSSLHRSLSWVRSIQSIPYHPILSL
jgi:hypothetical protein